MLSRVVGECVFVLVVREKLEAAYQLPLNVQIQRQIGSIDAAQVGIADILVGEMIILVAGAGGDFPGIAIVLKLFGGGVTAVIEITRAVIAIHIEIEPR